MNHRIARLAVTRLAVILIALGCGSTMFAAITFSVIPPSGFVEGAPGATVGWGFTFTNDTSFYLFVDSSNFCGVGGDPATSDCNDPYNPPIAFGPSLGVYTDFIAANFTIIAPNSTLTQSFNPAAPTGVGSYTINLNAPIFAVDTGNLFVSYKEFSGNPLLGGTPASGDIELSSAVSVEAIPEPATFLLMGAALAALGAVRVSRHRNKRAVREQCFKPEKQL